MWDQMNIKYKWKFIQAKKTPEYLSHSLFSRFCTVQSVATWLILPIGCYLVDTANWLLPGWSCQAGREGGFTNERPGNWSFDLRANERPPIKFHWEGTTFNIQHSTFNTQSDGHHDSMTDPAQRAESVKIFGELCTTATSPVFSIISLAPQRNQRARTFLSKVMLSVGWTLQKHIYLNKLNNNFYVI